MSKKLLIVALTLSLLIATATSALALSVVPVGARNIVTAYVVTDTYTLLYEGGIPYNPDSPKTDTMLVTFDGEYYVINLVGNTTDIFRHEEWRLAEDELLPPIIEEDCKSPKLEEVTIHRYWKDKESGEDAGETFEYMYRLVLPPHNINLNK